MPHKRYVCIPIISTYDRSNAFYTVDSICCSKVTSIWRPTVVICQTMYRIMYTFCTCLNLLNNVVPGAFTNGFLIFVSNPQSYVLHIFTILSSDYIQAMSPNNNKEMKKTYLRRKVFSCRIPTDAFDKTFVFIDFLDLFYFH